MNHVDELMKAKAKARRERERVAERRGIIILLCVLGASMILVQVAAYCHQVLGLW
jgi:hypothetical protein